MGAAPVQAKGAGDAVQFALAPDKIPQPAFSDGLTVDSMITLGQDKPPRPKMEGTSWAGGANKQARKTLKTVFGSEDQSTWDLDSPLLLQVGEVHGNQVYQNKSGDLPGDYAYMEYDTFKYQGDPKNRGETRVVVGTKGSTTRYFYTANHYTDFAEFDKA